MAGVSIAVCSYGLVASLVAFGGETGTSTGSDSGTGGTFATSTGLASSESGSDDATGTSVGTSTGAATSSTDGGSTSDDDASTSVGTFTSNDSVSVTVTDGESEESDAGVEPTFGDLDDPPAGCNEDDDGDGEQDGCCDQSSSNSDNFLCSVPRRGRDRIALFVVLVLLARPRRRRRP